MKRLAVLAAVLLISSVAFGQSGYRDDRGYSGKGYVVGRGGTYTPPPPDTTPPAAPLALTAFEGDSFIDLFWDASPESDFDHYVVYRGTTSGSLSLLHTMSTGEHADYSDNAAVNGTEYFYAVTAVDTSDNESDQSSEVSATPAPAALAFDSFSVNSASEAE